MACDRMELQDLLPDWVGEPGRLRPEAVAAVARHVPDCADCTAVVAVLRAANTVIRDETPALDLGRITAAATAARPTLVGGGDGRVGRAPAWRHARPWLAAAASIAFVVGVSVSVRSGGAGTDAAVVQVAELSVAGVGDLTADGLATLLTELDAFPAAPMAEPGLTVRPVLETTELP